MFVYFLLEHLSAPPKKDMLLAYRLLRYKVRIWEDYILEVNDHVERHALEALLEHEIGPEAKEAIVTAGQQLIEQGRQEGRQEGRREGECLVLLRVLRRRFGAAVDAAIEQRVMSGSIEQIDAWTEQMLSAATLGELFADGG